MKKILFIACIMMITSITAQDAKPLYEKVGDMVKVTNFYEDGSIKEQGFYKNKKLTGSWTTYDKDGNKTTLAHYKKGKKVGKWLVVTKHGLKEVNYKNNSIASVHSWKGNMTVASK